MNIFKKKQQNLEKKDVYSPPFNTLKLEAQ